MNPEVQINVTNLDYIDVVHEKSSLSALEEGW